MKLNGSQSYAWWLQCERFRRPTISGSNEDPTAEGARAKRQWGCFQSPSSVVGDRNAKKHAPRLYKRSLCPLYRPRWRSRRHVIDPSCRSFNRSISVDCSRHEAERCRPTTCHGLPPVRDRPGRTLCRRERPEEPAPQKLRGTTPLCAGDQADRSPRKPASAPGGGDRR